MISTKISKTTGLLSKLKYYLPGNVLFMIYNSLILSYLSYGNIVWANTSHSKLKPLFLLQKRCLRYCTNSHYLAHSKPLFRQLNTLNIYSLNKYQNAVFVFKCIKGNAPSSFATMFQTNSKIHKYNTRNSLKLHIWNIDKQYMQQSVRYTGPTVWNSLPSSLTQYVYLNSFKKNLKIYLLSL